jgi:hypothetical protein
MPAGPTPVNRTSACTAFVLVLQQVQLVVSHSLFNFVPKSFRGGTTGDFPAKQAVFAPASTPAVGAEDQTPIPKLKDGEKACGGE